MMAGIAMRVMVAVPLVSHHRRGCTGTLVACREHRIAA